jgi:hypothetical protein
MEKHPKFQFVSPLVFGIFSIVGGVANTLGGIDVAFGISRALPSLKFECSATTTKFGTFWRKRSPVGQKRLVHYFEQNSYHYHGHKSYWYTNFWLCCGS